MEAEVAEIASTNSWGLVYEKIRHLSLNHDLTTLEANKPINRVLNRYRDVLPYDHSRVVLWDCEATDYINASLVEVPRASRKYILAQGPLPTTLEHFWLAVWQRNTRAVLMLNKIIEKGAVKCHQYWPVNAGDSYELESVGLQLTHIESSPGQHYTVRTFKLTNTETGESREIFHFHYINWPDFGVPQCPDSFLEYLQAVRDSGSLDDEVGPAVVHCSAGIGRSGTFCLVDTCLVLIGKDGADSVCIKDILLEMRQYRMGLIQTAEQLRFSYIAIVEGAKQMGCLPEDALSDLNIFTAPAPPPQISHRGGLGGLQITTLDSTSSSDEDDEDDDDLSLSDDENAPPLPPRRSESLIKSTLNGLEAFANMPSVLQEQVNGTNECNTSSSNEPTPPDNLAVNHAKLTASKSAPLQDRSNVKTDFYSSEERSCYSTDSPTNTKCILNNQKMDERKQEVRRRRQQEKNALEAKVQEMKKKDVEAEEWKRQKQFFYEKFWTFGLGLSMLVVAGSYYWMRG